MKRFQHDFCGRVTHVECSGLVSNANGVPVGTDVSGRYTYSKDDVDPGRYKFEIQISFCGKRYVSEMFHDSGGGDSGGYTVESSTNAVFTWNAPFNPDLAELYFPGQEGDTGGYFSLHILDIASDYFVGLGFMKFFVWSETGNGMISLDFHVSPPAKLSAHGSLKIST